MNINALTSLLLELANQSTSKVTPALRAEGVAGVRGVAASVKKGLEALTDGKRAKSSTGLETKQTAEQPAQLPAFTPLPLRSGLFPEARFFAGLGGEKAGAAGKEPASDIFICLATETLGRIWAGLSCRKDFISVKFFTGSETSSKVLREDFPSLREDLKEAGFKEVSLTSRARAELGLVVDGLLPRFEQHLLDRRI